MSRTPVVPLNDRGLAYGDGLFETIRVVAGRAPLADRHLARLAAGAAHLGIPFDPADGEQALAALLAGHPGEDGIAKLVLTRGSGGRGYQPPARPRARLLSAWHPAVDRTREHEQGLTLALSDCRLADQPALAGLKHLNRLEQVLARLARPADDVDEVLMLDARGRPLELTSMNLFAVHDGVLVTPPLDRAGVAGVMRAEIIESMAPSRGLAVKQTRFTLAALRGADEVFACNSVAGVLPVRKLAVWSWPVGSVTRRLQQAAGELLAS